MIDRVKLGFALGLAFFMAGLSTLALAQQGWSQVQTIKQAGGAANINAVFYDGDIIWVVGADGFISRSEDDGHSWQETNLKVDSGLNDVFVRRDKVWIVGDGGIILSSTDGGRSFAKSQYTPRHLNTSGLQGGGVDLYSVQFTDSDHGYIVGDRGLILASTNGGVSWREQVSGTDQQLFHLSFQDERGWVVGTGGVILHTDNGGKNWYAQRAGITDDLNRVYLITDRVGLITGDNGVLLKTENGGATWERVALDTREPLFGISFIDKKTGWVVGHKGRIIRTYDGGRHWVEQDSQTGADLFSVSFYKNRGYAIGRDGLVMRYYEKR